MKRSKKQNKIIETWNVGNVWVSTSEGKLSYPLQELFYRLKELNLEYGRVHKMGMAFDFLTAYQPNPPLDIHFYRRIFNSEVRIFVLGTDGNKTKTCLTDLIRKSGFEPRESKTKHPDLYEETIISALHDVLLEINLDMESMQLLEDNPQNRDKYWGALTYSKFLIKNHLVKNKRKADRAAIKRYIPEREQKTNIIE